MKKYILLLSLFLTSAAFADSSKKVVNPCDSLEALCQNNYYTKDEMGTSSGKNLYKDCMLLIVSGFPPSRVNTSGLSSDDIAGCKERIKNLHDKY